MIVNTKLMIMVEKDDLPSSMGFASWCGICVTQLCQREGIVNKLFTASTESIKISK
jgi:bacterioferritin-associated ferredoxin